MKMFEVTCRWSA